MYTRLLQQAQKKRHVREEFTSDKGIHANDYNSMIQNPGMNDWSYRPYLTADRHPSTFCDVFLFIKRQI